MNPFIQIRELIRINRDFGGKSSKTLFQPNQKKSQLRLLARKFAFPGEEKEAQWAEEICKTDEHNHIYIRLRSLLRRRLLGQLSHLDIQTGAQLRKAIYQSAKEVFWIRTLIMFDARAVAIWLIPRALKRSRKYELTQDRIELLLFLRQNATLNGDKTKFAHYASELDDAMKLRAAEMKMQAMNEEIGLQLAVRARASEKAKSLARASVPEASMLLEQYPTYNIGLNYFRIATLDSESVEDVRRTLQLCNRANKFLGQYPHLFSAAHKGQFAIKRLSSAISIGDFASARLAVAVCEACYAEGRNNWFIWKESEFLLFTHSNDLIQAASLHKYLVRHERFSSQPEQVKEKWMLFGHYLSLASGIGKTALSASRKSLFTKILREVPIYNRDKVGYNASLLILQHLILASTGDADGMIQKSDALRQYISRYLRNRHESQLYGFLKLLLLLPKYDFDMAKIRKRGKRYIEQFQRTGREKIDESQTFQFDRMWGWISHWVETRVKPNMEKKVTATVEPATKG